MMDVTNYATMHMNQSLQMVEEGGFPLAALGRGICYVMRDPYDKKQKDF